MNLARHIREVGSTHSCSLWVGSVEKASELTVRLEGPITGDIAREGTWRGLIEGYPRSLLFGERTLIMNLDDGRSGKIKIASSEEGMAIFSGIGLLTVPQPAEEEEDEILGILKGINDKTG